MSVLLIISVTVFDAVDSPPARLKPLVLRFPVLCFGKWVVIRSLFITQRFTGLNTAIIAILRGLEKQHRYYNNCFLMDTFLINSLNSC